MDRLTKLIEDYQRIVENVKKLTDDEDNNLVKDYKALYSYLVDYKKLKDAIEAGTLVEQKYGHWLEWHEDGYDYECSNCQCRISYNGSKVSGDFNYCPECGRKMDEVE